MFRIDESDPRYLIAYDSDHAKIANYQEMMRRWAVRMERGERFGVILVTEPHAHPEGEGDHEHERDVDFEEAFTKLLNDFRRDHKADSERWTTAYARVMPADWLDAQTATNPDYLESTRAYTDRMARYMWGVPGSFFGSVEEARAWIDTQTVPLPSASEKAALKPSSGRVGLFYGSTTGVTEAAAFAISKAWEAFGLEAIAAVNIGTVKDLTALLAYDHLILGIPTWNVGQMQDDWEIAFPQLDRLDFTGKQIALFGIGDQYGYADNFIDAVGTLGKKFIERGATLVGRWYDDHYEFAESKAFVDGKFMGLALDDVHQREHSDRRINQWIAQLIHEFALLPASQLEA